MIDAIIQGDELAFARAYEVYRAKVYGYFLKKTRSREDARDLVQSAFMKLWKYRASLSAEYLLEQQLFHICRTVYIDHLRKQNRISKVIDAQRRSLPDVPCTNISPDFDIRSRVGSALAGMPELRKKIFELNRVQGYSYREIAQHLSISVKSVDNNLTKAIRYLRKSVLLIAATIFGLGM